MVITSAKEKRKESVKTLKLRTKHFHTQDDIRSDEEFGSYPQPPRLSIHLWGASKKKSPISTFLLPLLPGSAYSRWWANVFPEYKHDM